MGENIASSAEINIALKQTWWMRRLLNISLDQSISVEWKCESEIRLSRLCVFPQESVDLGEIMFSLCYLPTAGRLTLTVIKCRNLKAMDITGYSGVLCVCVYVTHLWLQWLK